MKGRAEFSMQELEQLAVLLREKQTADRTRQKILRAKLRQLEFYITDFASDYAGFTAADLDLLVARGIITVSDLVGSGTSTRSARHRKGLAMPRSEPVAPAAASTLGPGHRVIQEWMGEAVETLEDLVRPGLRAVCVGFNPAEVSVDAGHYYQGRAGQRFLSRLAAVGGLPDGVGWEDDRAYASGLGFIDIVKRPTRRAESLRGEDYEYGRPILAAKLQEFRPGLVIFSFKQAAMKYFGSFEGNGFVRGLQAGDAQVFVMPGPYERGHIVEQRLRQLAEELGKE